MLSYVELGDIFKYDNKFFVVEPKTVSCDGCYFIKGTCTADVGVPCCWDQHDTVSYVFVEVKNEN